MIEIRRVLTQVEDIHHEFGPRAAPPLVRGAIGRGADQSVRRPLRARHPADDGGARSGRASTWRTACCAAMDVPPERIEGYGKGAIVGAAGELEHGALWHVPGGYAMRELLGWKGDPRRLRAGQGREKTGQPGNALAIVPSTKKVGPPGAALDVPLTHINASYVRSHFDAIEVRVPGAPRADEIVLHPRDEHRLARACARRRPARATTSRKWDGLR